MARKRRKKGEEMKSRKGLLEEERKDIIFAGNIYIKCHTSHESNLKSNFYFFGAKFTTKMLAK